MLKSRINKRKWAYFYVPIFFLVVGSGIFWVLAAPAIQFARSSIQLVLLSEAPDFSGLASTKKAPVKTIKADEKNNIPSSQIDYPSSGTQYGQIIIKQYAIFEPLIFGDSDQDLRNGAGQYLGSVFPGEKGTTLIGGHNSSSFGNLSLVKEHDLIEVQTNYATYTYTVTKAVIDKYNSQEVLRVLENRNSRLLILYTCYPVDMLGFTEKRLFVYAELTSGPVIDENL